VLVFPCDPTVACGNIRYQNKKDDKKEFVS